MRHRLLPLLLIALAGVAAERPDLKGKVTDTSGVPVAHATVMVYSAGVRTGYSTFCPTCYVDCGKHAFTDSDGTFTIRGLSPELVFDLLVVKDGFAATWVKKVDPAKGPAETAALKTRTSPGDPAQSVRGRVVDGHGDPVADAVVEQQGVTYRNEKGQIGTRFGDQDWIDLIAVTNEKGEFELAYGKPAEKVTLSVSPRGMSSKLFTETTGADRKTLIVTEGATVQGRLVSDGKPVANAEIGLSTHSRRSGSILPEMRIGTKDDGTFTLTNVPAGRIWYLYAKMDSLAARGLAAEPVLCETKDDGQVVDLGDIRLKPAHALRGKVVLSDGKPIPADMRIHLIADGLSDTQSAVLDPDGRFEFKGLASGVYELGPGVKGYKIADWFTMEALVDRDIDNLIVTLQPEIPNR
jgi:protocatechuate 3,4-dioxygenase beta subunit